MRCSSVLCQKAFDRVPRSLIWWAMQKLGIDEWLIKAVQALYREAVSKAITEEFKIGCPWDLFYADDVALIAESLPELEKKFQVWKQGRWPCSISRRGVGRNSVRCTQCKLWTHKRCSNIKGKLTEKTAFVCSRCTGGNKHHRCTENRFHHMPGGESRSS
uniref:PHD-type domain-containing protein n=1 Tax=Octopus bimaculoides TaxID=37653 RepID=A0A0L8IEN0_OCTBM